MSGNIRPTDMAAMLAPNKQGGMAVFPMIWGFTGAEVTYLAGLYLFEEHRGVQIPVFAVLTRDAAAPVSTIHNRMPVILGKAHLREGGRVIRTASRRRH